MKTERDIIYTMLDTYRASEISNDERVNERFMRDLLRKHRPDSLRKHYRNGITVAPEVFQYFDIRLTYVSPSIYSVELPKIINFEHHLGFEVNIDGYVIPVVNPGDFHRSRKIFNTKYLPIGKMEGQKLTVYIGDDLNPCLSTDSDTYAALVEIKTRLNESPVLTPNEKGTLRLNFSAVLLDPDDQPGYDMDTSVYPFPSERLKELTDQILQREFGIIVQAKPDEIQNARPDKIRYHDQDDVSQN